MQKSLLSALLLVAPLTVINATPTPVEPTKLGDLEGRYALDCSTQKAHNLSYIIGNKSIFRLISAKQKHAFLKFIEHRNVKPLDNYQYLSTAKYQGFTVDFYQQGNQNWARVKNTSITNFYGPKTNKLLMQCKANMQT